MSIIRRSIFPCLFLYSASVIAFPVGREAPTSGRRFEDPFMAAYHRGLESLRRMVKEDPDVVREYDSLGRTALHYAALGGNSEIAEFLISKGAEVDARDKQEETPLHTAVSHGNLDVAEVLVRHGADVNAREEGVLTSDCKYDGRSVLSWATWGGNIELIKFLLKKGAKIEYGQGKPKDTALHWAVYHVAYKYNPKTTIKIIDLLAEKTGDINVRDGWKRTPLHIAVENGTVGIVRHLLENYPEIKINAIDGFANTPLDYARNPDWSDVTREEQAAMIGLLLKYGAKPSISNDKENQTAHNPRKPVEASKPNSL